MVGTFKKSPAKYPLGVGWANCFRTHNELTMDPLGILVFAPSDRNPDESINMSDLSSNESMANLSSNSTTPHHPMTGSPPTLINATFSPLNNPSPDVTPSQIQDNMETDNMKTQFSEGRPTAQLMEDQHPSKRKRTNTNSDDSGRNPPTHQFTPLPPSPLNSQHDNPTTTLSLPPGTGPTSNTPLSTISTPPPKLTLDLAPLYTSTPRTPIRTQPATMPRSNPSLFRADFIIPNKNMTGFIHRVHRRVSEGGKPFLKH